MGKNADIVRVMYDSFKAGEMARAMSVVDPHVEWVEHFPYPGTYVGPEALMAVFEKVAAEFDRYDMTFDHFVESEEMVVVIGNYVLHKRGASSDIVSRFVHAFWVRDSKVVRYEQFLDTAAAQDVVGKLKL